MARALISGEQGFGGSGFRVLLVQIIGFGALSCSKTEEMLNKKCRT